MGPSSHLMSDQLKKEDALKELLDFGIQIGLKQTWLQKRSVPWHTHFDIWGWKLTAAYAGGATEISMSDLADLMKRKKEYFYMTAYGGNS